MIITVDFSSDVPIYTQMHNQIVEGIARGLLKPGEALPSVRRMAADIGVHAHTVNKVYAILRDEGYVVLDRRSGCSIALTIPPSDQAFRDYLVDELTPLVAAAACRGMRHGEFDEICKKTFLEIGADNNE